ncbi:uncharacterized protein [Miscanthus floridulus]|uniref:uncharacterized protein n=1 Tax=Miscanthus floridulus TaxID=154761 RepID=UPI003459A699
MAGAGGTTRYERGQAQVAWHGGWRGRHGVGTGRGASAVAAATMTEKAGKGGRARARARGHGRLGAGKGEGASGGGGALVRAWAAALLCSKSCRLRWTNYLRTGIRRGGFSDQEDRLIVHLQALLGNRWATIASYHPDRTDNDVKNYWNTHLKKKLLVQQQRATAIAASLPPKGQWELKLQADINLARRALHDALSVDAAGPPGWPPRARRRRPPAHHQGHSRTRSPPPRLRR